MFLISVSNIKTDRQIGILVTITVELSHMSYMGNHVTSKTGNPGKTGKKTGKGGRQILVLTETYHSKK